MLRTINALDDLFAPPDPNPFAATETGVAPPVQNPFAGSETGPAPAEPSQHWPALATVDEIPLARELKSLPAAAPADVEREMPLLQLVGDKAVQREFIAQLAREGRTHQHPTRAGMVIIEGGANIKEMAERWAAATERVAMREDRAIVGGLVHRDAPRPGWHGGAVLGAASSLRELQRESVRTLVSDYPPNHVAKLIHEGARNPALLQHKDGSLAQDVIARVLDEYTRDRPGQGRTASVYEVANLTAGADRLARMLGPEHPTAAKAMEKNERLDAALLALGGQRYADIKAAAVADLKSAVDKARERADSLPSEALGKDSTAPIASRSSGRDTGMER
jgi:hypothetical protein